MECWKFRNTTPIFQYSITSFLKTKCRLVKKISDARRAVGMALRSTGAWVAIQHSNLGFLEADFFCVQFLEKLAAFELVEETRLDDIRRF